MSLLSRILLVAFLAVFSAGSVVHAGGAASMTMEMAMTDSADSGMVDCKACGGEDGDALLACDFVCASGAHAAVLASDELGVAPGSAQILNRPGEVRMSGLGSPPPGHPPRPIL